MGMIRSTSYVPPVVVNGVALGQPVILTDDNGTMRPQEPGDSIAGLRFCWDDAALPNAELLPDGTLVPDAPDATP